MTAATSEHAADGVRVVRLSKWYGRITALQDVSLHLGPGIWGLLGPNGSGKSTFMKVLSGQLRPSLGSLTVLGEEPFGNRRALAMIGICPEADALYDELTAFEFVSAMAGLAGFDRAESEKRAAATLATFGLEGAMHRKMGGYSRGMRQRAKLAQAVVHDPRVLLLDEPLTGTDPASRHAILEEIRRRAATGTIVLFSTHVLHEVEALTEQVLLLVRGQLVAQGEVHAIRDLLDEHPHHVRVECAQPRALAGDLVASAGVVGVRFPEPGVVELETDQPDMVYGAVAQAVVAGGHIVHSITSPDATLDAVFHYLVDRAGRMAGTGADAAVGSATSTSPSTAGGRR